MASDRDAGAINAAIANSRRAGVEQDITFERKAISAVTAPAARGAVVSNPPYGKRLGTTTALRNLYARLGQVIRRDFPEWSVTLLSADRAVLRQTRLPFDRIARTSNGGIPVDLMRSRRDDG
jgi:23S rRNA G2445 N2-methylase RlmL